MSFAMGCCAAKKEEVLPPNPRSHKRHSGVGFHEQYLLGKKVSVSGYGQTHIATKVEIGKPFIDDMNTTRAVKVLDLRFASAQFSKVVHNEVNHWKKVGGHKHCVRLHDVFYGNDLCYMVMERTNGTLLQYLERTIDINEKSLGEVFAQMLKGLEFVHESGTVHRDIKPDTFFVGGEMKRTIKLGDFGFSTPLPTDGTKLRGECGTPPFNSPEMLNGVGYDEKTDVWSFGVLVYVLLFGRYPYMPKEKGATGMKAAITAGEPIYFGNTHELSYPVLAFSMKVLERKPDARPSAEEALHLAYMDAICGHHPLLKPEIELTDLRPALQHAKRMRAFEQHDLSQTSTIDELLNRLQMAKLGVPIPLTQDMSQQFSGTATTKTRHSRHSNQSIGTIKTTKSRGKQSRGGHRKKTGSADLNISADSHDTMSEECDIDHQVEVPSEVEV